MGTVTVTLPDGRFYKPPAHPPTAVYTACLACNANPKFGIK